MAQIIDNMKKFLTMSYRKYVELNAQDAAKEWVNILTRMGLAFRQCQQSNIKGIRKL